jgi:alkylation response protein AidB-like acyl-CoA dehydrogenase
MDTAERDLVMQSVRHILSTADPAAAPEELLRAGWAELAETETEFAYSVVAECQGQLLVAGPALDLVWLHAAAQPVEAAVSVVLPLVARNTVAPGVMVGPRLVVDGLVLAGHQRSRQVCVPTADGVVRLEPDQVTYRPVGGSDPGLGLHRARAEVALPTSAPASQPTSSWPDALAAGRRFLAAELTGLADRMLRDTVAYVLERRQYGRQIGSFQAVKHLLANVRVAINASRSGLAAAWDDRMASSAMAAKALAAQAHELAAANCHQVHGGMAFTEEYGFHRMIRRGQVLDGLLGGRPELATALGRQILADRSVPRTPGLRAGAATAD